MSILVYKQRHRHPNKKSTPGANYAHIRYIATRPRVLKQEGAKHGLFGKLEPGSVKEFATWEEIDGIITDHNLSSKLFNEYSKKVPIFVAEEE